MRLLVTGGAGFIGSNFIRYELAHDPEARIVNLDKLTYAGNLENLADVAEEPRYAFVKGDVAEPADVERAFRLCEERFGGPVEAVVHFAAESHVDRSIEDAAPFLRTNVLGTHVLLEASRRHRVERYIQVSTDEVYGSLGPDDPPFTEESPLRPNSPYAASKAAADLLVRSYVQTYGFPAIITRCSNNFGPYQFPEKLIPLAITFALEGKPVPVYGDGSNVRDWIYVEDHCRGIDLALRRGRPGAVYNFGARSERANLDLVRDLLRLLGRPDNMFTFVPDRPGHDRRYAIDPTRAETELGWTLLRAHQDALQETVAWYLAHGDLVKRVQTGEYLRYTERMYGRRDAWLATVEGTRAP